jgi:hypothetical protein
MNDRMGAVDPQSGGDPEITLLGKGAALGGKNFDL